MKDLIRSFERTGLRAEAAGRPLRRASADIFQMDIERARGGERFRLWRGAAENVVRVADADRRRNQLVLLVQEARREFTDRIGKWAMNASALAEEEERGRLVRRGETRREWIVSRWTEPTLRRFLCGLDERHYFVAQFAGGTSVRDAHRQLKPEAVRDAERSQPGGIVRQGEWFFLRVSSADRTMLRAVEKHRPWVVRFRTSLGGNGRPHIAEAVVVEGGRVFARGAVRHPDHKTLVLDGWHLVHRNAEVQAPRGVFWID